MKSAIHIFPDKNKIAKVIPVHKKSSTNDVNNYRPISLLSTFCKIMEKLMAARLNKFLDLHSIIFPNQFGFREGCSTTHSLVSITETINKTIEQKKIGCGVFIDFKNAFDTISSFRNLNNMASETMYFYGFSPTSMIECNMYQ